MGISVNTAPFDLNRFWEKTPTPLKYLLLVGIIVGATYFFVSRKVDTSQLKNLTKMEQSIDVTYQLVEKFEAFATYQTQYNDQLITDVKNIYTLLTELNNNVNTKFNYIIKSSGQYNQDLIDKMELLNQSFDKLTKAYEPENKPQEPSIKVTKKDNE